MNSNYLSKNKWKYLSIAAISAIVLLIMAFSFFMSDKMINKYGPLVDAAMEIKLEATTAHLWLEEILSGDRFNSLESVLFRIDESAWYANAMLYGGKNTEGSYQPLEDESLRTEIVLVIKKLDEFKDLTLKRFDNYETSVAGTDVDQQYDQLFESFIRSADNVETLLQQKILLEKRSYESLQIILTIIVILLGCLAILVQFRYDRSHEDSQRKILESSSLKDEFIAAASHELRTPMVVLSGYTELLLDNPKLGEEVKKEYFTRILDKIDTISRLIDELLDVSRMESGRLIHVEYAPVKIFNIAQKAMLQFEDGNHSCQLTTHFDDEQLELDADCGKLFQVFENLIGNAIKYSPDGGQVEIKGERTDGLYKVTVADEGIGLDPMQQKHVFQKFYRANPSKTMGLGIGLYLVKHIIESHNGRIWFDSSPGKGTTFSFTLPIEKQEA